MIFKKAKYWLLVIVILALVLRLYNLSTPLADWHSWRQADTASVAREYVKNGLDLLHPQYHDLSNIPSGKDNLLGYRMVEFPLVNALVAESFKLFAISSVWPIHVWYRFSSVIFSLGSLICLYFLVKQLFNLKIAIYSTLFFAVIPYNIFYNRSIFPENALVFFSLLTLLLSVLIYRQSRWWLYILMGLSGAIALLLKPTAVFMLVPLFISAYYIIKRTPRALFYVIPVFLAILIPTLAWRRWITQFPEGIPASSWLLNSNGIRFRPAWFRWLLYERLIKLILGFTIFPLFITGLIKLFFIKKGFTLYFILAWIVGMFTYLAVFATGNVHHDYYQIMTIPLVCLLLGLGIDFLFRLNIKWLTGLVFALIFIGLIWSWSLVSGYYQINHGAIVKAGQAVDRLIPPGALVIAPYQGDTAFLYQTNRRGWPIGGEIEAKIKMGASHYVSVNFDDETNVLRQKYPVVAQTPEYIILQLTR